MSNFVQSYLEAFDTAKNPPPMPNTREWKAYFQNMKTGMNQLEEKVQATVQNFLDAPVDHGPSSSKHGQDEEVLQLMTVLSGGADLNEGCRGGYEQGRADGYAEALQDVEQANLVEENVHEDPEVEYPVFASASKKREHEDELNGDKGLSPTPSKLPRMEASSSISSAASSNNIVMFVHGHKITYTSGWAGAVRIFENRVCFINPSIGSTMWDRMDEHIANAKKLAENMPTFTIGFGEFSVTIIPREDCKVKDLLLISSNTKNELEIVVPPQKE